MRRSSVAVFFLASIVVLASGCSRGHEEADTRALDAGSWNMVRVHADPSCPVSLIDASVVLGEGQVEVRGTLKSATRKDVIGVRIRCEFTALGVNGAPVTSRFVEVGWEGQLLSNHTMEVQTTSAFRWDSEASEGERESLSPQLLLEAVEYADGGVWTRSEQVSH